MWCRDSASALLQPGPEAVGAQSERLARSPIAAREALEVSEPSQDVKGLTLEAPGAAAQRVCSLAGSCLLVSGL